MFEGRTGFLTGNLVLDLSILAWFLAQLDQDSGQSGREPELGPETDGRQRRHAKLPLLLHLRGYGVHRADLRWQAPLFSLAAVVAWW